MKADVKITHGEHGDGVVRAARLAKLTINGEEIPHLVDFCLDFPINGTVELVMSIRPTSVDIDASGPLSPDIVIERLARDFNASVADRSLGSEVHADRRARHIRAQRDVRSLMSRVDTDTICRMARIMEENIKNFGYECDVTSRDDGRRFEVKDG